MDERTIDRHEVTEIINIGTFPIRRLRHSGFLSATDFYNQANPVMLSYQNKPSPYWYIKVRNIDYDSVQFMINSVIVEKFLLNRKGKYEHYKYFENFDSYYYVFNNKATVRKKNYYFHPILFFYYYKLFFGYDRELILNYMYKEYMKVNIVRGLLAEKWVDQIYKRYFDRKLSNVTNPIIYFHVNIMTLVASLGDHLLRTKKYNLGYFPVWNVMFEDLITSLQMHDISNCLNLHLTNKNRLQANNEFIKLYTTISQRAKVDKYIRKKYYLERSSEEPVSTP